MRELELELARPLWVTDFLRLRYDSKPQLAKEELMNVRWKVISVFAILSLSSITLTSRNIASAAVPSPASEQRATASLENQSLSIPSTTTAINSPSPMSERVVHYDIDARYDVAKHIVNATEVLTY